jgi:hypothetical protein
MAAEDQVKTNIHPIQRNSARRSNPPSSDSMLLLICEEDRPEFRR